MLYCTHANHIWCIAFDPQVEELWLHQAECNFAVMEETIFEPLSCTKLSIIFNDAVLIATQLFIDVWMEYRSLKLYCIVAAHLTSVSIKTLRMISNNLSALTEAQALTIIKEQVFGSKSGT